VYWQGELKQKKAQRKKHKGYMFPILCRDFGMRYAWKISHLGFYFGVCSG
jgi:hypothetical protein